MPAAGRRARDQAADARAAARSEVLEDDRASRARCSRSACAAPRRRKPSGLLPEAQARLLEVLRVPRPCDVADRSSCCLSPLLVAQALATRRRAPRAARSGRARARRDRQRARCCGCWSSAIRRPPASAWRTKRRRLAGHLSRALAAQCGGARALAVARAHGLTTRAVPATCSQRRRRLQPTSPSSCSASTTSSTRCRRGAPLRAREALANWLRNAHGVRHVVFAPLPPVHRFPLCRSRCAGSWAATRAATTRRWRAGPPRAATCRTCRSTCRSHRGVMAGDGFHPGEPVYRVCGVALAEHIAAHVWPRLRPTAR